jgi:hypothetical protein
MQQSKRHSAANFGDILASFDRGGGDAPSTVRHARRAEPGVEPETETEAETAGPPRPRNPLRRLFGNISMPWPAGIGGLIGGFAQRPPAPYVEEAVEEQTASPPYTPPKPDAASVELPKTEDHAIAAELGLDRDLANVDLQRIRRDFAKKNHPDRFEPARRATAARRMSTANMLIDEQMRRNSSPPRVRDNTLK